MLEPIYQRPRTAPPRYPALDTCKGPGTGYFGIIENPARVDNRERAQRELRRPVIYRCVFCPDKGLLECEKTILRLFCPPELCRAELNGMPLKRVGEKRRMGLLLELDVGDMLREGENCLTIELPPNSQGISQNIELIGVKKVWIKSIGITQRTQGKAVLLDIKPEIEALVQEEAEYSVTLTSPSGLQVRHDGSPREIMVENPELWWPRGYGDQPLYELELDFEGGDSWRGTLGLRTFSEGTAVNGLKIFPMGGRFRPNGMGRRPDYVHLLRDCAGANFNCVQIAGEIWPGEDFYDECDRLGILVMQEMLPDMGDSWTLSPELSAEINARGTMLGGLGRHACMWKYLGARRPEYGRDDWRRLGDYIRVYEYILPKSLWKTAPKAIYLPEGYGVMQELCEPSCSCIDSLLEFTDKEDRGLNSQIMEGNMEPGISGRILELVSQELPLPGDFAGWAYASALCAAKAIGRRICRLRQENADGAMLGGINEVWPGASEACIDYAGRKKAVYYELRRSFATIRLECGLQPENRGWYVFFSVDNETTAQKHLLINWSLRDGKGRIKREETIAASIPALRKMRLDGTFLQDVSENEDVLCYQLFDGCKPIDLSAKTFTAGKHYCFKDPELSYSVEGDELIVKAKAFAQGVEIFGGEVQLSDNFFDMPAGERRIKILGGDTDNLQLHSVYDLLKGGNGVKL